MALSCTIAFFYILLLLKEGIRFEISFPDILLLIIVILILINRFKINNVQGFSIRYYELLGLIIVYIALRKLHSSSIFFFIAAILGGIIQAIYGNLQLYKILPSHHDLFSITGSFFNPGPYAGYLATIFPIALGIYMNSNVLKNLTYKKVAKNVSLISIITIILILPASESRAAWLSVISSIVFFIAHKYNIGSYFNKYFDPPYKRYLITLFLSIIIAIGIIEIYSFKKESSNGRLFIWKVTLNLIKENPLIGLGFDRFKSSYMDSQRDYFQMHPKSDSQYVAGDVNFAFNEFLQFTAENGIPTALLLLIILFYLFYIKRKSNPSVLIAKAGLISALIFSLFSYSSQILAIKLNGVLFLSILVSSCPIIKTYNLNINGAVKIMTGAVLAIYIFFTYNFVKKIYSNFENWQTAYLIYSAGQYHTSIRYYEISYPFLKNSGVFLMQYGKALSMDGQHKKAISILNNAELYLNSTAIQTAKGDSYRSLEKYSLAEKSYYNAYFMNPSKIHSQFLLLQLYDQTKQSNKAIKIGKEILTKRIKVQSTAVNEILLETRKILSHY
jgi:O-antigen ligase